MKKHPQIWLMAWIGVKISEEGLRGLLCHIKTNSEGVKMSNKEGNSAP